MFVSDDLIRALIEMRYYVQVDENITLTVAKDFALPFEAFRAETFVRAGDVNALSVSST